MGVTRSSKHAGGRTQQAAAWAPHGPVHGRRREPGPGGDLGVCVAAMVCGLTPAAAVTVSSLASMPPGQATRCHARGAGSRHPCWEPTPGPLSTGAESGRICPATGRGRGPPEDTLLGRLKAFLGWPEHPRAAHRPALLPPAAGVTQEPLESGRRAHACTLAAGASSSRYRLRGDMEKPQPQAAGLHPAGTLQGTWESCTPTSPRRDGRASPDWERPTHTGRGWRLHSVCDVNGDLIHKRPQRHTQVSGPRLAP